MKTRAAGCRLLMAVAVEEEFAVWLGRNKGIRAAVKVIFLLSSPHLPPFSILRVTIATPPPPIPP